MTYNTHMTKNTRDDCLTDYTTRLVVYKNNKRLHYIGSHSEWFNTIDTGTVGTE